MRYQGTDNAIMIQEPDEATIKSAEEKNILPYAEAFSSHYRREFGFEVNTIKK